MRVKFESLAHFWPSGYGLCLSHNLAFHNLGSPVDAITWFHAWPIRQDPSASHRGLDSVILFLFLGESLKASLMLASFVSAPGCSRSSVTLWPGSSWNTVWCPSSTTGLRQQWHWRGTALGCCAGIWKGLTECVLPVEPSPPGTLGVESGNVLTKIHPGVNCFLKGGFSAVPFVYFRGWVT